MTNLGNRDKGFFKKIRASSGGKCTSSIGLAGRGAFDIAATTCFNPVCVAGSSRGRMVLTTRPHTWPDVGFDRGHKGARSTSKSMGAHCY